MIIIIDDTFGDRINSNDNEYLKEPLFYNACKIYTKVKTIEIAHILNLLPECKLFCYHKSLQLYNGVGLPLGLEDNVKYRESLINKVLKSSIPHIEFSGGFESDYKLGKIDKDLFYKNLKPFLESYIETKTIVSKILFLGKHHQKNDFFSMFQQLMMQIRMDNIHHYKENKDILDGMEIILKGNNSLNIIDEWINAGKTKNEIIQDINSILKQYE